MQFLQIVLFHIRFILIVIKYNGIYDCKIGGSAIVKI